MITYEKLSQHVSYWEGIKSNTAKRLKIDNTPNQEVLENMILLSNCVFEPVRKILGNKPIYISSFYRCEKLNKAVGGSSKSDHVSGYAMDIDAHKFNNSTNADIFNTIVKYLPFDVLIWEFGTDTEPDWVHVSFKRNNNKSLIYKAIKDENNKTNYINITDTWEV